LLNQSSRATRHRDQSYIDPAISMHRDDELCGVIYIYIYTSMCVRVSRFRPPPMGDTRRNAGVSDERKTSARKEPRKSRNHPPEHDSRGDYFRRPVSACPFLPPIDTTLVSFLSFFSSIYASPVGKIAERWKSAVSISEATKRPSGSFVASFLAVITRYRSIYVAMYVLQANRRSEKLERISSRLEYQQLLGCYRNRIRLRILMSLRGLFPRAIDLQV